MILWGIATAFNSWFLEKINGNVTVIAMYFEESHYTTIMVYNSATKTSLPQTTYHPDAWRVVVSLDGMQDDIYVSKEKYVTLKVLQKVNATYTLGRFYKSLYLKSLS